MDNLEGAAAIIGLVNGILLFQNDRSRFPYFVIAVAAGLIFGLVGWFGLNLESGFILGLASSGFYKVSQVIGNRV